MMRTYEMIAAARNLALIKGQPVGKYPATGTWQWVTGDFVITVGRSGVFVYHQGQCVIAPHRRSARRAEWRKELAKALNLSP